MDFIFKSVKCCLNLFFKLFYKFEVYGISSPYQGGAILAANHTSFYDPPLIAAAWPEPTYYLARATLFRFFFFGWFLKKLHAYPIEGTAQDIKSFKTVNELLDQGKKVVIFPEGHRSYNGTMNPIKTGVAMLAMRSKCPIIPVYIHGAYETWPRKAFFPKIKTKIICSFGSPIFPSTDPETDKKGERERLTQQVQSEIEKLRDEILKKNR